MYGVECCTGSKHNTQDNLSRLQDLSGQRPFAQSDSEFGRPRLGNAPLIDHSATTFMPGIGGATSIWYTTGVFETIPQKGSRCKRYETKASAESTHFPKSRYGFLCLTIAMAPRYELTNRQLKDTQVLLIQTKEQSQQESL